jgi:hypothetical protein
MHYTALDTIRHRQCRSEQRLAQGSAEADESVLRIGVLPMVGEVVPTFAGRVCRVVRTTDPSRPLISVFYTGSATFSFK